MGCEYTLGTLRVFEMDGLGTDRRYVADGGNTIDKSQWVGCPRTERAGVTGTIGLTAVDHAVAFKFTGIRTIEELKIRMYKLSSTVLTGRISIQADSGGDPDGSPISGLSHIFDDSDVELASTWVECASFTETALTDTNTYWIVVEITAYTSGGLRTIHIQETNSDDFTTYCYKGLKVYTTSWGSLDLAKIPQFLLKGKSDMGHTSITGTDEPPALIHNIDYYNDLGRFELKNDETTLYRAVIQLKALDYSWKHSIDAIGEGYFKIYSAAYGYFSFQSSAPDLKGFWDYGFGPGNDTTYGSVYIDDTKNGGDITVEWNGTDTNLVNGYPMVRSGKWNNSTQQLENYATVTDNWEDSGHTVQTDQNDWIVLEFWFKVTDNNVADDLVQCRWWMEAGGGGNQLWHLRTTYKIVSAGGVAYTKTTDIDALLKAALTKSTGLDSLLKQALSKTTDLDAILAFVATKTAELDALLTQGLTKTVDLDSLLLKAQEKTTELDAYLKFIYTKDADFDALLTKAQEKTSELDAILQQTFVREVDLDALLKAIDQTKSTDLDAYLKYIVEKTTELDALVKGALTKDTDLDAWLQQSKALSLDLDSILKAVYTKDADLDALLTKAQEISTDLDAWLKKVYPETTDLDALLKAIGQTHDVDIDAFLLAEQSKTTDLDSLLLKAQEKTTEIDALIKAVDLVRETDLDAILNQTFTKDLDLDAILQANYTKEAFLDALIHEVGRTVGTDLDAILYVSGITTDLDAILKAAFAKETSLDALLKEIGVAKTTFLDALLKAVDQLKTTDLDAILKAEYLRTLSLDALISTDGTLKTTDIDAWLKRAFEKETFLDALLRGQVLSTTDLDALLKVTDILITTDLDAILKQALFKTLNLDSLLTKTLTAFAELDALITKSLTKSTSIDSLLTKSTIKITDLDAILAQRQTKDTGLDAWLLKVGLPTTGLDSLILKAQAKTSEIDAILLAGYTKTLEVDALLKANFTKTTDIDALLKYFLEITTNLDAILESGLTARAYGEENPSQGEFMISWATWLMSEGGAVTVIGDSDWGKIQLVTGELAQGPVFQMGAGTWPINVIKNRYGSGQGSFKVWIRGATTNFAQLAGSPSWEEWTGVVDRTWTYGQVRLEGL